MIDFCKFKLFISLVNFFTTKDFTICSISQQVLLTVELQNWNGSIKYIYVILLLQESSCVFEYFNGILMIESNFEHGWQRELFFLKAEIMVAGMYFHNSRFEFRKYAFLENDSVCHRKICSMQCYITVIIQVGPLRSVMA